MFIIEQDGEMRSQPWPTEKKAKRAAKVIYEQEYADGVLSLTLWWNRRKDGTSRMYCDDGITAWATAFIVRRDNA